jgi:hypothetical protein
MFPRTVPVCFGEGRFFARIGTFDCENEGAGNDAPGPAE